MGVPQKPWLVNGKSQPKISPQIILILIGFPTFHQPFLDTLIDRNHHLGAVFGHHNGVLRGHVVMEYEWNIAWYLHYGWYLPYIYIYITIYVYHIYIYIHMGVSWNRGTPKSSTLIGCSLMNHPFWGYPHLWKPCICIYIYMYNKVWL